MALNLLIFNLFHSLTGRWDILDRIFIFFAKDAIYLAVFGFVIFLLLGIRSRRSRAVFFAQSALALIVSMGIMLESMRTLFHFARPFVALGFEPLIVGPSISSFPSGHAIFIFTLSALIFPYNKKLGAFLFALSALVGAARIFAGVHWPADILFGAIFGIGGALFARKLIKDEK